MKPTYEATGPLTVCPCCGDSSMEGSVNWACNRCFGKYYADLPWDSIDQDDGYRRTAQGRLLFSELGERLRAEGKLPPLSPGQDVKIPFDPRPKGTPAPRRTVWDHLVEDES